MSINSRTVTEANKAKGSSKVIKTSSVTSFNENTSSSQAVFDVGLSANHKPAVHNMDDLIRSTGKGLYNHEFPIIDIIPGNPTTKIIFNSNSVHLGRAAVAYIVLGEFANLTDTTVQIYDLNSTSWISFEQDSTPTGNQWSKSNSRERAAANLTATINGHSGFTATYMKERDNNYIITISQASTGVLSIGQAMVKITTTATAQQPTAIIHITGEVSVDKTIRLVSSDGESIVYTAKAGEDLSANEFETSADLESTFTSLKDCIEHLSGHNGKILCVQSSSPGAPGGIDDMINFTQAIHSTEFSNGDTRIDSNLNNVVINDNKIDIQGHSVFLRSYTGFDVMSNFKGGENATEIIIGGIAKDSGMRDILNANKYTITAIGNHDYGSDAANYINRCLSISVDTSAATYTRGTHGGWVGIPEYGDSDRFDLSPRDLVKMIEETNMRLDRILGWTGARISNDNTLQDNSVTSSKILQGSESITNGDLLSYNAASPGAMAWTDSLPDASCRAVTFRQANVSPSNDQVLTYDDTGSGDMKWADSSGGTSRWTKSMGGYKTNNNSSAAYYFTPYVNYHSWTSNDASPTTVSYGYHDAACLTLPADATLTRIDVSINCSDTGATDPLKFYVFKGTKVNEATTITLTELGNTGTITPITLKMMTKTATFSSGNTISAGDSLWVMLKKDSTTGNQDAYFHITISGEYV